MAGGRGGATVHASYIGGEGIKSLVGLDKQEEQQQQEYSSIRGCDNSVL